jgi:hypothetical protein
VGVSPPRPSPIVRDKAQIEKLYGVTEDEIEELREWIASAGWPAAMTKTFMKHLDADLVVYAWCEHCNRSVKVRSPNYAGFVAVAKLVSEYKLRKTADMPTEINVTHRIGPARDLSQLSTAQLREIAAGTARVEEVQEGEWEELPPVA